MLTIRVLGTGLIPRGLGIAPRMTPTKASLNLIQTILLNANLSVEYCKPDGTWNKITSKNLMAVWNTYANKPITSDTKADTAAVSTPATPEPKFTNAAPAVKPAETNVVNEKTEAPVEKDEVTENTADVKDDKTEKKDDKKDNNNNKSNNTTFKPVNNPNDKHNK